MRPPDNADDLVALRDQAIALCREAERIGQAVIEWTEHQLGQGDEPGKGRHLKIVKGLLWLAGAGAGAALWRRLMAGVAVAAVTAGAVTYITEPAISAPPDHDPHITAPGYALPARPDRDRPRVTPSPVLSPMPGIGVQPSPSSSPAVSPSPSDSDHGHGPSSSVPPPHPSHSPADPCLAWVLGVCVKI